VVVFTGAGRAFSAGGDFPSMLAAMGDTAFLERAGVEGKRMFYSQLELEKPLICRMNGLAFGLGATLGLLCDIVIADEEAKICDPHVAIGLVAGDGGAILWPQMIGFMRAREYLLTGEPIQAREAARIGLINRAVPAAELDDHVYGLARRILKNGSKAVRWTKTLINTPLKQLASSMLDIGVAYETISGSSTEHRVAIESFLNTKKTKQG
jgi:enoyl-CoA hydratase